MPIFRENPSLLGRFKAGDPSALAAVYAAYVGKITGLLARRRLRSTRTGQPGSCGRDDRDLVQDVFMRAFSRAAREAFDGQREYGPYLAAITRNILTDSYRRAPPEILLEERSLRELSESRWAGRSPVAGWTDAEVAREFRRFLGTLPPTQRALFERRYLDGLSQGAAARELGLSRQELRTREGRLRTDFMGAITDR